MRGTSSGKEGGLTRKGGLVLAVLLPMAALLYLALAADSENRLQDPAYLWVRLIYPLLRTVFFISLSLLAGQVIEGLGWTARLGRAVWPLINWARLPGAAGASFTAAFVSGVLANSLLYTSWQEGKLSRRAVFVTNLLNASLPAYVLHMPTTILVIISLTGQAGLIYVGLTFLATLLRFLVTAAVSRTIMPECPSCTYEEKAKKKNWSQVWSETWTKFRVRLRRMVLIVVPVYMAVVLSAEAGFFVWLRDGLASLISSRTAPVEAMSLVIFAVTAEFTSGFAAAGALLEAGSLTVKQVVLSLLAGTVAATPVRALRHQLPHYMGIYTPKLGLELMLVGQGARVLSIVLVGAVFVWLY